MQGERHAGEFRLPDSDRTVGESVSSQLAQCAEEVAMLVDERNIPANPRTLDRLLRSVELTVAKSLLLSRHPHSEGSLPRQVVGFRERSGG